MRAGRTKWIDVPHEEGARINFRILAARELDEAEVQAQIKALAVTNTINPEQVQAIRQARQNEPSTDRYDKDRYDKDTLIKYGVAGCSDCDPCNQEAKDLFDPDTRDWAVDMILELNIRPLARGKDSNDFSLTENSHQNSPSLMASTSLE